MGQLMLVEGNMNMYCLLTVDVCGLILDSVFGLRFEVRLLQTIQFRYMNENDSLTKLCIVISQMIYLSNINPNGVFDGNINVPL
jgi:hypothetical protein